MLLGSSNISVDEDDYAPKIQLRSDVTDPYIYVMEELPTEEEEDVPNVASKPYVGMEFNTSEKAYTFYNDYACRVGFSIRKATQGKNRDGVSSIRTIGVSSSSICNAKEGHNARTCPQKGEKGSKKGKKKENDHDDIEEEELEDSEESEESEE
ncbi:Protein FAR1-RELATED SEQUENCE 12 [Carex littledalei]|uniref:Protein FAR1-RELATED SEQUENCE 12 n=1 Tax=Carex littledalei TaxID=544730 RepID=A0A833VFD6_9POAL|nr:Protein FAR1-RELATED SEQUENCE 12 [Carex littledalei]